MTIFRMKDEEVRRLTGLVGVVLESMVAVVVTAKWSASVGRRFEEGA